MSLILRAVCILIYKQNSPYIQIHNDIGFLGRGLFSEESQEIRCTPCRAHRTKPASRLLVTGRLRGVVYVPLQETDLRDSLAHYLQLELNLF